MNVVWVRMLSFAVLSNAVALSVVTPPTPTAVAPVTVMWSIGPSVHERAGVAAVRGFGEPITKSALGFAEYSHPPLMRRSAVVALSVGASKVAGHCVVPYATRSTTLAAVVGHAPWPDVVRAVVVFTRATRASLCDIAIVPIVCGVGKFVVPAVPAASCTR